MSYRKQISYLELQENGQRIRGAGYAKLESWEKEEILMVQLRGQGIVSGKEMMLYLQRESGEELLCEMTAERGTVSCEKRISRKADWEPTLGIRIPLERNFEIIGRFAGAAGAKKVPAPVTAIAPVTVGEIEGQGQGGNQPEQAKRPRTDRKSGRNRSRKRKNGQWIGSPELEKNCHGTHSPHERHQMGAIKQYLPPHPSLPGCQGISFRGSGGFRCVAGALLSDDPQQFFVAWLL